LDEESNESLAKDESSYEDSADEPEDYPHDAQYGSFF
jgi:hypothetical protein